MFLATIILLLQSLEISAQGGYTLDFNGTDEYVEVPYSSDVNPSGSFSIECWAKVEGGSGTYRSPITSREVFTNDSRGYILYAGVDNNWQFWTGSGATAWSSVNSSVTVTSDWTHIAGTFDGTTLRIYVDGELANSASGSYAVNPVQPLQIGVGGGDSHLGILDYYFPGKIDEVRIWSDVRDADEIRANMSKELSGSEANLEAYYQMSDGSGSSLTDNSSNSHTGTISSSTLWKTSGALAGPGMTLDFDGTDDYVSIGDQATLEGFGEFSIEAWFTTSNITAYNQIINKNLVYALAVNDFGSSEKNIVFALDNGSDYSLPDLVSASEIEENRWYHVAVTRNSANLLRMYIDGTLDTSMTISTSVSNSSDIRFGASSIGTQFFDGKIDEVRFWNDERTQEEIRTNMYRSLEGNESGLLAYYRFDQQNDASHTTLYDLTGNGNNGTLNDTDATLTWVTSDPFNTWIGSEDSDWSNGENWSDGSSPSSEDVGIFAWNDSTNMPASATISARNFSIASGATLSHSGDLTLSGNLYNEGSFTTTGTVTFSGSSAQSIEGSGSLTAGTLTLNNANGLSMEQDVTTTTSLTLTSGTLSIGANTLTINGAISQSSGSLTGGSTSNISIGGSGASTSLPAVSLNNLTLNRANGISLSGTVSVAGALTLTNGVLNLNSQMLDVGSSGSISGTPGSSNHIQATSGSLRKNFSGTGSFNFPTGDGSNYTPINLNFSSGSFTSAYTDISLTTSKHPNNSSSTDFLSRYWTVSSSGISGFSCDVTATYANGDINGTESNMVGGKWDGSWTDLGAVTAGSNLISGTVSSFSDFTAGRTHRLSRRMAQFYRSSAGTTGLVGLDHRKRATGRFLCH